MRVKLGIMNMSRIVLLVVLLTILPTLIFSQTYTISGYIMDKKSGEALIGATVIEKEPFKGTSTNGYGFYSFSLPAGEHRLVYSYIGYENVVLNIRLTQNVKQSVELAESTMELAQATVTADQNESPLHTNVFEVDNLTMKEIKKLPTMFGQPDVVKAVQLQTGVKTIGDGSSGMFIRGGSADQNLILIDEAPIYNPSHFFGLISVFNPDVINNVDLYKSNMPAQYGGRASAVVDCKMNEGNVKEYDFSFGISPFDVIASANGPIVKDKAAFLVSVRKSLIDIFFTKPGEMIPFIPGYYDVNVKLNTKIGEKDRLFLSVYNGKDRLKSYDGFFNRWGNTTATLRWTRDITPKLFLNVSAIYSNYKNYMEFKEETRTYKWLTGLSDANLKADMSYYFSPKNSLKFGVGTIYHGFIPGETADSLQSIPRIQAFEHSIYILNDVTPLKWLGINYGVRLSIFQNIGKTRLFEYDEFHSLAGEQTTKGGVYKTYARIEPRVNFNFMLHRNFSLKVAYARNAQYMQVLQNNTMSYASLETWFPANPNIKPLMADVVSAGWFQSIKGNMFSFSVEGYYKWYGNQIDFVDHAELVNNPYIEGEILSGTARAYGVEVAFKKNLGKITGSLSYSYARALRKIDGINEGKEYSSPYDIPHDFRIMGNYQITPKWSVSAVWMYQTGRPVTLPIGFYYEDWSTSTDPIPIYSDRNSSRFPDYHRLDISATYSTKVNPKKFYWTISFGVFNAYARKNPYCYNFVWGHQGTGMTNEVVVEKYSLFSILPNVGATFHF